MSSTQRVVRVVGYVLALQLFGAAGCSDDAESDADMQQIAQGCTRVCSKIVAAGCSDETETQSECEEDCREDLSIETCASENNAYLGCLSGRSTVSCDDDGDAEFAGCDNEAAATDSCSTCIIESHDDECTKCQRTQCCTERKALRGMADESAYYDCQDVCYETSPGPAEECLEGCNTQYPQVRAAEEAKDACELQKCQTACQ